MTAPGDLLSELGVLLERLTRLYQELAGVARDMVTHMGWADMDALHADVAREEALIRQAQEQDGLRRQLLELIGNGYGVAPMVARRMTSSQLLRRVDPGRRPELEQIIRRLRRAAAELSEANRLTGLASSQVLTHMRELFAAMSRAEDAPAVYTRSGRTALSGTRRIFETTG